MKLMMIKLGIVFFVVGSGMALAGKEKTIVCNTPNEEKTFTIIGDYDISMTRNSNAAQSAQEVVIFQEDFEQDFPKPRWENSTDSPSSSYRWGMESYNPHAGANCLWCVGDNDTEEATLNPSTDGYPGSVRSWAEFGPFNLHDAEAAILSFYAKLDLSNPNDEFFFGYSVNGKNYQGYSVNGQNASDGWIPGDIALPDSLLGKHTVWIGFIFTSDSTSAQKGVFIDDVRITKQVSNPSHAEVEVFYDLGYTSNTVTWEQGKQVAMLMNSGLEHRSKLIALRFYIFNPTSFTPEIYNWNNGKPGDILWQSPGYSDLVEGWNTINVAGNNIYVDSAFVVSFGYEDSQIGIGYNELGGLQRSWIYTGVQWATDPDPYTYSMHAIILPNKPPSEPTPLEPVNLASNQELDLTLKWTCSDEDGDALFYDIYLDGVNPPSNKIGAVQEVQQYNINDLQYDKTYYWKIVAWDIMVDSSQSSVFQFSTKPYPPGVPTLVNPPNNSSDTDTSLTLQWEYTGQNADSVLYNVLLDTINPPAKKIATKYNEKQLAVSSLSFKTTYYWQVIAWNSTDSSKSEVYHFATKEPQNTPPNKPSLTSPPNNATDQPTTLTLQWSATDDDGDELFYDVYLDISNPPGTLIRNKTRADTATLVNLEREKKYYWQVIASDGKDSTASDIYQFTTALNNPPNKPILAAPPNNASDQSTSLTLQWVATDNDGDDLLFDVYLDSSNPPTSLIREKTDADTANLSNLEKSAQYFWQVIAYDDKDSTASEIHQFTTVNNTPPNRPIPATPPDNASNQSTALTLQWVATDNDGDDLSFDVFLDTSNPPSALVREKTTADTVNLSNLNYDNRYYWQIIAWDGSDSTHSKIFDFTTETESFSSLQYTIAGGTDEQSYIMFSVPGLLDDASPRILENTFGSYDDTKWRFFQDNNESVEYPNTGPLEPGRAFWLISKETKDIEFGSGKYVSKLEDFSLSIVNGWNQIGNPFYQSIDWNDIKNANPGANIQGPYFYESGYSELRRNFEIFDGCYIYVENLATLILPGPNNLAKKADSDTSPFASADWFIRINAECRGIRDNINYLGMDQSSKDEFDALDYREPPAMGDYISVYFDQDQWQNNSARYTTNFVKSNSLGARWNFKVGSSMDNEKISLTFSNIKSLPAQWRAVMYDLQNGDRIQIEPDQNYQIINFENVEREFVMLVGTEDYITDEQTEIVAAPQYFQLYQNYPNPFNSSTTIKYDLPADAHVAMHIFDVNGRLLQTLFDGNQSSGRHAIIWNADKQSSGVYVLKIVTNSQSDFIKLLYVK